MRKDRVLFIRCDEKTEKEFKMLTVQKGFRSYCETLRYLLGLANRPSVEEF